MTDRLRDTEYRGKVTSTPSPSRGTVYFTKVEQTERQDGFEERRRYLAGLRSFFLGGGLCGVGGVLKNRMAMSSIVMGLGAVSRFGLAAGIAEF